MNLPLSRTLKLLTLSAITICGFASGNVHALEIRTGGCDTPTQNYEAYLKTVPFSSAAYWYPHWKEHEIGKRFTSGQRKLPTGIRYDQIISIVSYGGGGYMDLNKALRNGTEKEGNFLPFIRCLDSALKLLPVFRGTTYRYARYFPPEVDATYKPGEIIKERAYTSTSQTIGWATSLTAKEKSRGYYFVIQGKSGRHLGSLVTGADIRETLFPAGTCFKIDSRAEADGKASNHGDDHPEVDRYVEIHMHEAACPPALQHK